MNENTQEQHYNAALDSVAIVTSLVAQAPLETELKERLLANANHLQIMIAKNVFTSVQKAALQVAIDLAATVITLDTPPIPTVPQSVTMRQARLALAAAGLLSSVNQAVAAGSEAMQIEWEFAATVDRNWPTLAVLQAGLSLTDEQIDTLFVAASAL